MKYGTIACIVIFVSTALLALIQLWFTPISWSTFIKLLITLGILFVIVLGITLAKREYLEDKSMRKKGYIE